MKKINYLFILSLLVLGLTLQSCSSDDDSGNTTEADTFIRFTIDGTDYEFTDIVSAESAGISLNGGSGELLGLDGDTQMAIFLPLGPEIGTYQLEDGFTPEYAIRFTSNSLNFDFDFANGTLTLSENIGDFVGTFEATVTNADDVTITIENGEFRGVVPF